MHDAFQRQHAISESDTESDSDSSIMSYSSTLVDNLGGWAEEVRPPHSVHHVNHDGGSTHGAIRNVIIIYPAS